MMGNHTKEEWREASKSALARAKMYREWATKETKPEWRERWNRELANSLDTARFYRVRERCAQ